MRQAALRPVIYLAAYYVLMRGSNYERQLVVRIYLPILQVVLPLLTIDAIFINKIHDGDKHSKHTTVSKVSF